MIDNKKLLGNDNDIFQIKEVLEKSLDNKWTQEFVYLLRKFFYIEYWSNVEKNERYTIQMIQEVLKKHLDFLDEDRGTEEVMRKFRAMLPYLQQLVISDMKAAYEGDPAAKSYEEIIAAYPGPLAILIQRTANCLYKLKVPILPRIMTEYAHSITGIDIHPGAEIGESFFIDHGTGVVIGETAVIGNHVKIYQGVTLGALSTRGGHKQKWLKRHPTVEDNVTIYAGATILGGNTVIGKNSIIGGNAWVTQSVPPSTKIFSDFMEMKLQPILDYIINNIKNWDKLIQKEQQATLLLFEQGEDIYAHALYKETKILQYLNHSLSKKVLGYLHENANATILEIGAGTGATSNKVLSDIRENKFEEHIVYFYTDISRFFLQRAKERYKECDGKIEMHHQTLDIDEAFSSQLPSNFQADIVIAVGVLNNSVNTDKCIYEINSVMKPGGILLVIETVEDVPDILITQSFMMTAPKDRRKATNTMFLNRKQWLEILEENGFCNSEEFPGYGEYLEVLGQKLFYCTKE